MRRREFIAGLGGAATWPLAARAQPTAHIKRVGVLMAIEADDPQQQNRMATLRRALQDLGWVDGHNVRIVLRSGSGAETLRKSIVLRAIRA